MTGVQTCALPILSVSGVTLRNKVENKNFQSRNLCCCTNFLSRYKTADGRKEKWSRAAAFAKCIKHTAKMSCKYSAPMRAGMEGSFLSDFIKILEEEEIT